MLFRDRSFRIRVAWCCVLRLMRGTRFTEDSTAAGMDACSSKDGPGC
jgi:hypothetical protein